MSQTFKTHGNVRGWGPWVTLSGPVEGRWACPGMLGRFLKCVYWVSRACRGPTDSLAQVAWMGLALQANGIPTARPGHQRGSRHTHCHLLGEVGQGLALTEILKTQAQVAPGGLGGFVRPGPLRAVPGPLEHGHLVPGGHWPPLLPLRGSWSKSALACPLGQGEQLTSLLPCLAESPETKSTSVRPGLSHRAAARVSPGAGPAHPASLTRIKCRFQAPPHTYTSDAPSAIRGTADVIAPNLLLRVTLWSRSCWGRESLQHVSHVSQLPCSFPTRDQWS